MHLTFLQSSNVNKERFARKSEAVLPYRKIKINQNKITLISLIYFTPVMYNYVIIYAVFMSN